MHSLCQPQIAEVDVFDSDMEDNFRTVDKGSDHDDNEDSGFRECQSNRSKESKSFSFNEEDDLEFKNELSDDMDLESYTQLRMTLGHGNIDDDDAGEDLLIVNKMAKGTIKALKDIMPQALRRICVLHLCENFASKTLKLDGNTNNFVESFNNAIVKRRGKLIYTMLEEIRKLIRARFDKRFQMLADWDGNVTPFVEKKLKQLELEYRNYNNLVLAGRREFDVREGSINFTVNLGDHYCDYKRWQISSSPRKYAARERERLEKHKRRKSRLPIPQQVTSIHLSGTKRCKNCKQLGHNSLTCGKLRDENGRLKYKKKS
ncbi:hypothetical protein Cgig2_033910 [Carnegiea gigantea]|uniref:Uncharacterized protein n=1 Tax=Carnegiea gigantea TaxID=171969 RepID=A0A9Q1GJ20_9CARY|nr:hypothetical protein Cgig2_033910 [Carnegiea gigantea]